MKRLFAVMMLALLATGAMLAQRGPRHGVDNGQGNGPRHMRSVDDQLNELSHKLKLTEAQKPGVRAILQDEHDEAKRVMDNSSGSFEDNRSKMRAIHEDANTKLRALLTEEQQTKFAKLQEEHRKQAAEGR